MISARLLRLALPAFTAAAALAVAAAPAPTAQAASSHGAGTKPVVPIFTSIPRIAPQQAVAPPAAATAPGIAATGQTGSNIRAILFYTGTDSQVFAVPLEPQSAAFSLGGRLIGGPGPTFVPPGSLGGPVGGIALFGRGTDNALWAFGSWFSLGGVLTSRPGAAAGNLTGGESIDVAVRGSDGAVWEKHLTTSVAPWRSLGGRVLAGTGPGAVNVGGTLFVLVVGTDHAVWVNKSTDASHWSGWRSLGGRTNSTLAAATPAPGVGVAFVRGTNNALWFNEFAGTTTGVSGGWHSRGGVLTSGTGAGSEPDGMTWAVVLGTDGHIWANSGVWPAHAWSKVF